MSSENKVEESRENSAARLPEPMSHRRESGKVRGSWNLVTVILLVLLVPGLTQIHGVQAVSHTWDSSSKVTLSQQGYSGPGLSYDPLLGKMFMAWQDTDLPSHHLRVMSSADMTTWSANSVVAPIQGTFAMVDMTYDSSNQQMYLSFGTNSIICNFDPKFPTCTGGSAMYVTNSTDESHWSTPRLIQQSDESVSLGIYGASIAYNPVTNTLVLAATNTAADTNSHVYLFKSTDAGNSWDSGTELSYGSSPIQSPRVSPTIRYVNGNYLLAYVTSDQTIHTIQSSDLTTWSSQANLSETTTAPVALAFDSINMEYHLAWVGTDLLASINDIVSSDAVGWASKTTFESTQPSPALAYNSFTRTLLLAWTGPNAFSNSLNVEQQSKTVNSAKYGSETPPPSTMCVGQTANVAVTMVNSGAYWWPSASASPYNVFRLGSQPQDNTFWGRSRVELTTSVPPFSAASTYTFNFMVTAPSIPGTYNFKWEMVQEGVAWFGETSPDYNVNVYACSLNLSPNPSFLSPDGASSSTITAQTSPSLSSLALSFATTMGTLSAPSCVTGPTGSCMVSIVSGVAGVATIIARAPLYASGSTSVSFTGFTILASPNKVNVVTGQAGTSTITVSPRNGWTGVVTFATSVSPSTGLTCTLSPTSVTGAATSTITCTGYVVNNYAVTVTGASGSTWWTTTLTVSVQDFTISAFTSTVNVPINTGKGATNVAIVGLNGFAGAVTLSAQSSSTSITATLNPTSITPGVPSILIISGTAVNSYTVTVTGTVGSNHHSLTIGATINNPPSSPGFAFYPSVAFVGQPVTFTATVPSSGSYTFSWNFGDGTSLINGITSTHTYTGHCTCTVTMTQTDSHSNSLSATQTVTVLPYVLTPSFTFSPSSPVGVGQTISFSGVAALGQSPYTYSWNFGDGTTASGNAPTHSFGAQGYYRVVFTATDGGGYIAQTTQNIQVGGIIEYATPPLLNQLADSQQNTVQLAIAGQNGFSGQVTLNAVATPADGNQPISGTPLVQWCKPSCASPTSTSSTTTASVQVGGFTNLNMVVQSGTSIGYYNLVVSVTGGPLSSSTFISDAVGDFSMQLSNPNTLLVAQGSSNAVILNLKSSDEFAGPVTLSELSGPSGSSIAFSSTQPIVPPNSIATSTVTVYASSTMSTGSYSVLLQGVSIGLTHSVQVNFQVTPSPVTLTQTVVFGDVTATISGTLTVNTLASQITGTLYVTATNQTSGMTLASQKPYAVTLAFSSSGQSLFVIDIAAVPFWLGLGCSITVTTAATSCSLTRTPDINHDGIVNISDLAAMAVAFDSTPGSSNWIPAADLNADGIVNISDLAQAAFYMGSIAFLP